MQSLVYGNPDSSHTQYERERPRRLKSKSPKFVKKIFNISTVLGEPVSSQSSAISARHTFNHTDLLKILENSPLRKNDSVIIQSDGTKCLED